jgi:chloramphenicol 3-O phosphotransferase
MKLGQIILLNGVPRAGKSSIVRAIQETYPELWMNLGVDVYMEATPPAHRPGIGLRPGGERPDLEDGVQVLYSALFESIAAHSRRGLSVVVDAGLHEGYSRPLSVRRRCAECLKGFPVLFVGVYAPLETVMARRNAGHEGRTYVTGSLEQPPLPVRRWQEAVYQPGWYDLEVDTSRQTPTECAEAIRRYLEAPPEGPTAFERLSLSDAPR